jgi:hypothetical protein
MDEYDSSSLPLDVTKKSQTVTEVCNMMSNEDAKDSHRQLVESLDTFSHMQKLEDFCKESEKDSPMFKATLDYMDIVATILMFIRASREGLWILHLASLEKLCSIFFIQNRLKYVQHIPEYIAKMHQL